MFFGGIQCLLITSGFKVEGWRFRAWQVILRDSVSLNPKPFPRRIRFRFGNEGLGVEVEHHCLWCPLCEDQISCVLVRGSE